MNYNPQFQAAGDYSKQPPIGPPQVAWKPVPDGKAFAVTALATGLIGVVFGLIPAAFLVATPLGICGIIFGLVSRKQHKAHRYIDFSMPLGAMYEKGDKVTINQGQGEFTGKIVDVRPGYARMDTGRPVMALWGVWLGTAAIILGCIGFAIVMSALNDLGNDINNIDTPTETTP